MPVTTCIFDAYGTLFDVSAAARRAASEPDHRDIADDWPRIAEFWRQKQLQYSWIRAITGAHTDFWQVTQDGLDWTLEKTGHAGDAQLRERLLALYWELQAYPEVPAMLAALKQAGLNTAILSNGSPGMLEGAIKSAGIGAEPLPARRTCCKPSPLNTFFFMTRLSRGIFRSFPSFSFGSF